MSISNRNSLIYLFLLFAFCEMKIIVGKDTRSCISRKSPCFGKKVPCPNECPYGSPTNSKAKVCYLDCDSPTCETQCKSKIFHARLRF